MRSGRKTYPVRVGTQSRPLVVRVTVTAAPPDASATRPGLMSAPVCPQGPTHGTDRRPGQTPRPVIPTAFLQVRPGADDGIRTRDPHLGKVVLYQLSHVRVPPILGASAGCFNRDAQEEPVEPKPPSPRTLGGRSSAQRDRTAGSATITSWAIRSPVVIETGSKGSRLTTAQITSPR
jgi:hypothetical protein